MFYSAELLSIKNHGGLSVIWIAATLGPRSQTRRLSRKDYTSVDIEKTCRYVQCPPEPLSLRLASNLMVGVSRVYGQQCQIYYLDAQAVWLRMAQSRIEGQSASCATGGDAYRSGASVTLPSTKATKESITHAEGLDLSFDDTAASDNFIPSGGIEDLLALTPEAMRRASSLQMSRSDTSGSISALQSAIRSGSRATSLDAIARGESTSDAITSLPFDKLQILNEYGFDDLVPGDPFGEDAARSGDFVPLGGDPFKRSTSSVLPTDQLTVPDEIDSLPDSGDDPAAHKRRRVAGGAKRAPRMYTLIDDETVLERDALLFRGEEGLSPKLTEDASTIGSLIATYPDLARQGPPSGAGYLPAEQDEGGLYAGKGSEAAAAGALDDGNVPESSEYADEDFAIPLFEGHHRQGEKVSSPEALMERTTKLLLSSSAVGDAGILGGVEGPNPFDSRLGIAGEASTAIAFEDACGRARQARVSPQAADLLRAIHAIAAAAASQRPRKRTAVAFDGLAQRERWSRAATARSFHGLLDLATLGALSVAQDGPFAAISMAISAS